MMFIIIFFIIHHVNWHFGKTARLHSQLKKNCGKTSFQFFIKTWTLTKCAVTLSHLTKTPDTPTQKQPVPPPGLPLLPPQNTAASQHKARSNPAPARPPMAATHQDKQQPGHVRWTGGLGRSYTFSPYITTQLSDLTITAAGDPAIIPWWPRTSADGENNGRLRAIMSWLCYLFLWVWSAHEFRL